MTQDMRSYVMCSEGNPTLRGFMYLYRMYNYIKLWSNAIRDLWNNGVRTVMYWIWKYRSDDIITNRDCLDVDWNGHGNECLHEPWFVWDEWYKRDGLLVGCFYFVCWGLIGGCEAISSARNARAIADTNRRNKSLISVDRRTSLLSYLQYSVSYQSRLQRIYCSQCPKGDWIWCWAEAYRYAWTQRAVSIVAFQHGFWLRGVQSLSCRW